MSDCQPSPLYFNIQPFFNQQCQECSQNNGCLPTDNICYTGPDLTCSTIHTADTLTVALQKIDIQICSAIGDYSNYQFHCLTAFYGQAITTEAQFVDAITSYVCDTTAELVAFTGTTFPTYQSTVTEQFNAVTVPEITCSIAGVTSSDNLNTILTKYCTAFNTLHTAIDLSSVTWNNCFVVSSTPTTIAQGFSTVLSQICQLQATSGAVLPTFNNTTTCLASPGTADTLVATIGKIITRLCQTATFNALTPTWGCVTTATDLQSAIQNILTPLNVLIKNNASYSSDFVITQNDNSNVCAGIHVALATPINQDRLVAATTGDSSPGTLIQKLTPGTNIGLDFTTTPGQIIINATNNATFSGITSDSLIVTTPGSPSQVLTIELLPSVQSGNQLVLGSDGLPYVPANSGGIISITRSALLSLIATSSLQIGQKYLITDYKTIYTQPISLVTITGASEPLIVTATTINQLAPEAKSTIYTNDIVFYNINNNTLIVPGCTFGYIYRRIDVTNNNDIPFDFRAIMFRRYGLNVVNTWSSSTTYTKNAVVVSGSTIYISRFNNNLNNILTLPKYWRVLEWTNGQTVSPTKTNWVIGDNVISPSTDNYISIPIDNTVFTDYLLFSQGITSNTFNNIIKESFGQDIISANNSVFLGSNIQNNSIGNLFTNNTISDFFENNHIGDSFRYNSIASNFTFNRVDDLFENSLIGTYFKNNSIATSVNSLVINSLAEANTFESYVEHLYAEDSFINNKIGLAAHRNTFGINSYLNELGSYCEDNIFGANTQLDIIGNNAIFLISGDGFQSNKIGNYSANNIFGNNSTNNVISHYFSTNTMGVSFDGNYIGLSFQNSTFGDTCQNNTFVDFCNSLTIGTGFFGNQVEYPFTSISFASNVINQKYIGKTTSLNESLNSLSSNFKILAVDNTNNIIGYVLQPIHYDVSLSQTGTSNPTLIIRKNTLPSPNFITWIRISAGLYTGTLSGGLNFSNTATYIQALNSNLNFATIQVTSSTTITITTQDYATNTGIDGLLTSISIKLELY